MKSLVAGARDVAVNYFAHRTAAERYAKSRPYFHPLVIERMRTVLDFAWPVRNAVDVACGTGQSAVALAELADSVIAVDLSPAMLAQAPEHPRIRYVEASAEELPVESQSAQLMTVSLALHWLDRTRFLAEARRILQPGGALVIYGNDFHGRMQENPEFAIWYGKHYFARYPTPPRNKWPLPEEEAQVHGFTFAAQESYTNTRSFSPEELAQYLMTHSNVIAAVEQGGEPVEAVFAWLLESLRPLFPDARGTFVFGGDIWFLKPRLGNE